MLFSLNTTVPSKTTDCHASQFIRQACLRQSDLPGDRASASHLFSTTVNIVYMTRSRYSRQYVNIKTTVA